MHSLQKQSLMLGRVPEKIAANNDRFGSVAILEWTYSYYVYELNPTGLQKARVSLSGLPSSGMDRVYLEFPEFNCSKHPGYLTWEWASHPINSRSQNSSELANVLLTCRAWIATLLSFLNNALNYKVVASTADCVAEESSPIAKTYTWTLMHQVSPQYTV